MCFLQRPIPSSPLATLPLYTLEHSRRTDEGIYDLFLFAAISGFAFTVRFGDQSSLAHPASTALELWGLKSRHAFTVSRAQERSRDEPEFGVLDEQVSERLQEDE